MKNERIKQKHLLPITMPNKFQILTYVQDEAFEVLLVGDSIICDQLIKYCVRVRRGARKRYSVPGTGINCVTDALNKLTSNTTKNTLCVFHGRTNDIQHKSSEELLEKNTLL